MLFIAVMLSASEIDPPRQLFKGHDLSEWKHVGPGEMVIEKGLIRTSGGMGLLYFAGEKFGDCVIRVVYRMEHANDNSGVFIRIPEEPTEPWMPVNRGYEVQIDNDADDYHATGVLYSLTRALARPGKPGPEWNTMEITLDGSRTVVFVNGIKVTDHLQGEGHLDPPKTKDYEPERGPRPAEGYIGLQNHSDNDIVYFKDISVRPLK